MQTVQSGPSAARLHVICAASAVGARSRSSHNPTVVGSSPTRPTSDSIQNHPSLWSDLLVVTDVVARPGTVIVFHQICDHYMGTSTSQRSRHARGTRGVVRNTGEQSALHPPLLSRPPQGLAQSACMHNDADRRSSAGVPQSAGGRLPGAKIGVSYSPAKMRRSPRRRSRVATGLCSFRGHRDQMVPASRGPGPPGSYNAPPGPASSRWISAMICLAGGMPGMSASACGLRPSAMRCHRSNAIWVK